MHRIDTATATPGQQFTDGDPGAGLPATVVSDDFLNAVQEEIAGVVEGSGIALQKVNNTQLLAAIRKLVAAAVPAGSVQAFAGSGIPAGWLLAAGQTLDRVVYQALFAALGTTYGAPSGSTFKVPDMRGEYVRGLDSGRGVDPGREIGSFQSDSIRAHSHGLPIDNAGGSLNMQSLYASAGADEAFSEVSRTTSFGGTETRTRNVAMLFIIKT